MWMLFWVRTPGLHFAGQGSAQTAPGTRRGVEREVRGDLGEPGTSAGIPTGCLEAAGTAISIASADVIAGTSARRPVHPAPPMLPGGRVMLGGCCAAWSAPPAHRRHEHGSSPRCGWS